MSFLKLRSHRAASKAARMALMCALRVASNFSAPMPAPGKHGGFFGEIMGMSNVELVGGACGEYLSEFFRNE